jgi:hypothetical protein
MASWFVLFAKYQVEEDKISSACSMNWGEGEFLRDIGEKTIRKETARQTKSGWKE